MTEEAKGNGDRYDDLCSTVERRLLPAPPIPALRAGDPDMRVLLGIPMERTMGQLAFFGFAEILIQGWPLARLEYTRNDIARCKFAEFLLHDDKYTHLVMLDSDHVHPPNIIQRLARWFLAYPEVVEVVGGLNFRRGAPYDPCAFIDPGDGHFRRMAEWQTGAMEVEALGTGSLMVARTVFERLEWPWFGYDYTTRNDWPGTDMWFSGKCREAGIALWCDSTTSSPHVGDRLIAEQTYREWLAEHLEELEGDSASRTDSAAEPLSNRPGGTSPIGIVVPGGSAEGSGP